MSYGSTQSHVGARGVQDASASAPQPRETAPLEGGSPAPGEASHDDDDDGDGRRSTTWAKLKGFYQGNIGLFFVFLAQICASLMSMTTRLLETGFETKFHALQIIFVRMLVTAVLGSLYMWYNRVPDFPLGARGVRRLLVLRGLAGFTGLFGSYYSLSYLDISDATVITFLVPTLTALVCWAALREPFTIREATAGLVAFVGVLFIARPTFLFPAHDEHVHDQGALLYAMTDNPNGGAGIKAPSAPVSPGERSFAVVCAVVGSFGAAVAYSTIRVIGARAHSLVSVNYFAVLATVVSGLVTVVHPDLRFEFPRTTTQWLLLAAIGLAGFLLQFLLTEGLRREKAGRATNLIYTQMVFALIIERVVWGTTPPPESLFGSALIIGGAVWNSLHKSAAPGTGKPDDKPPVADEESRLLERSDSGT